MKKLRSHTLFLAMAGEPTGAEVATFINLGLISD